MTESVSILKSFGVINALFSGLVFKHFKFYLQCPALVRILAWVLVLFSSLRRLAE